MNATKNLSYNPPKKAILPKIFKIGIIDGWIPAELVRKIYVAEL